MLEPRRPGAPHGGHVRAQRQERHRRRAPAATRTNAQRQGGQAHQQARLLYTMLTRSEEYVALELAPWETECHDRTIANLQRQVRRFELALVPTKALERKRWSGRAFPSLFHGSLAFDATRKMNFHHTTRTLSAN